jgi:hypothetical protein
MLHLVEEYVIDAWTKALHKVAIEATSIGRVLLIKTFKVDAVDVRLWDAPGTEFTLEKLKDARLSAASHPGDHFDYVLVLPTLKPGSVMRAWNKILIHCGSKPSA